VHVVEQYRLFSQIHSVYGIMLKTLSEKMRMADSQIKMRQNYPTLRYHCNGILDLDVTNLMPIAVGSEDNSSPVIQFISCSTIKSKMDKVPAVPPDDYSGTQWRWEEAMRVYGYMSPDEEYVDLIYKEIPKKDYNKVVNWAEKHS